MNDRQTITLNQIESHPVDMADFKTYIFPLLFFKLKRICDVKRQTATTSADGTVPATLSTAWEQWQTDARAFWQQMDILVETLDGLTGQESEKETEA
ncbi:hypothetical protein [Propionivibrio sp.]|uniref:hypothetical protein n=1 Tax=Propionivibrio sp. TaxID=2212460 RepID=UPI00261EF9C6|nr:hypothetical protein [Propionivibrio sp.]